MGLTIHYSGSFRSDASLSVMIEEVKDIAEVFKWRYMVFETEFPTNNFNASFDKKLYGIHFTPPECETVSFCFLSNGKMSSAVNLQLYGDLLCKEDSESLYMLFVKTQFAGLEIHKFLIHLFKYLEKKYFDNFHVIDEGEYWETGNEELLQKIFNRYTQLLNSFAFSLENNAREKGESMEAYFKRILQSIKLK